MSRIMTHGSDKMAVVSLSPLPRGRRRGSAVIGAGRGRGFADDKGSLTVTHGRPVLRVGPGQAYSRTSDPRHQTDCHHRGGHAYLRCHGSAQVMAPHVNRLVNRTLRDESRQERHRRPENAPYRRSIQVKPIGQRQPETAETHVVWLITQRRLARFGAAVRGHSKAQSPVGSPTDGALREARCLAPMA